MFKRNLEVKLVKPFKSQPTESTPQTPKNSPEAIACELLREGSKAAALVTATYVLADTLRKVTVHVIATKFN